MELLKEFASRLPMKPGVYRMIDAAGEAIYVGKAKELRKRVSSYFQKGDLSPRIALMVTKIARIETTVTRTESEALILENNLIKSLNPRFNILFRDDKSYPYIALSGSDFPRLSYYRGSLDKKGKYFGPYPNAGAAKESIHLLQKLFRLRTCEDSVFSNRSRPCLLHQIRRCSGPCVGFISRQSYMLDVKAAGDFLNGRQNEVLLEIERRMIEASKRLDFEQAAIYRDQMQSLIRVQEKQYVSSGRSVDADIVACIVVGSSACVNLAMIRGGQHLGDRSFFPKNADGSDPNDVIEAFLSQHYHSLPPPPLLVLNGKIDPGAFGKNVQIVTDPTGEKRVWLDMAIENARISLASMMGEKLGQEARLDALRSALNLPDAPSRIECFDVSHTRGEATVASCVVYDRLSMQRSEYRRYNMEGMHGDDFAALKQALKKRYGKGEGIMPDLILIDGGRLQLDAAWAALHEFGVGAELIGIVKGEGRRAENDRLVFRDCEKPLQLERGNPGMLLLQEIRDEAHRFAIAGHRAKRGKARTASTLEEIEGVGAKRRQRLLARFGGLQGMRSASIEELEQTDGISRALAEKIYRHLH